MDIGILSVRGKEDTYETALRKSEISNKLQSNGYSLTFFNEINLNSKEIVKSLNKAVNSKDEIEVVVIANALSHTGTDEFKKIFSDVIEIAENHEKTPVPKNYWKNRKKALKQSKKNGEDIHAYEKVVDSFRIYRKKSKIFSLGDFGNDYKGYTFMYKGIKVVVLPQAILVETDLKNLIAYSVERTLEVYELSANEYPDGFSLYEYIPPKTGFVNRVIPLPGDSAKEVLRKFTVIVSLLAFCTAFGMLVYNVFFLSVQNTNLNGDIQTIFHSAENKDNNNSNSNENNQSPKKDGDTVEWNKLTAINDEIVGWIEINDTPIDYPILWHKSDNSTSQYYLSHTYNRNYSSYGSIFVDYRCPNGMKDKNVILHGHHMNDGSMFGGLLNYGKTKGNLDFYKKAPTISISTADEGATTYKIISVFKTSTLSDHGEFFNYMIGEFQNEKDFMNYVYNVRVRSLFNCPVDVNEDDTLLTLSTCSYEFSEFRTVVVARKVRNGESEKVDVSQASLNSNPVWPDVYYKRYGGTRPTVTDFCTAYEIGQIDWYSGEYDFKGQVVVEPATEPTNSSEPTTQGTTAPPTQAPTVVVTFINYDGTVINSQKVEVGKSAKAPETPVKPSDDIYDYVFKGWQLDFSNVNCDMTIAPNFERVEKQIVEPTVGVVEESVYETEVVSQ